MSGAFEDRRTKHRVGVGTFCGVRIPEEMLERIARHTERTGESFSRVVRRAVTEMLDRDEAKRCELRERLLAS